MKLGATVNVVRSNRVLVGDQVCPAVIVIKNGKIHEILSHREFSVDAACEVSLQSQFGFSVGYLHNQWK